MVIASITSCTNTSNPAVLLGAGLLAKTAVERGISVKPWVKTSLAPGSRVVTDYLKEAGLMPYLEALGFHVVGYGCATCIGNSGPLPEPVTEAVNTGDLVVAAVLSGNRNFEGRINPHVRMNYLASPPLVVAYALAGEVGRDLDTEPLGMTATAARCSSRTSGPPTRPSARPSRASVKPEQFRQPVLARHGGRHPLAAAQGGRGQHVQVGPQVHLRAQALLPGEHPRRAQARSPDIQGARVLALLGDSVTTDHISPAGNIAKTSPAAKYLMEQGVEPKDFNSYGARRGNHEVMVRGTFANIRLKNLLVPGVEGGVHACTCPPASG